MSKQVELNNCYKIKIKLKRTRFSNTLNLPVSRTDEENKVKIAKNATDREQGRRKRTKARIGAAPSVGANDGKDRHHQEQDKESPRHRDQTCEHRVENKS